MGSCLVVNLVMVAIKASNGLVEVKMRADCSSGQANHAGGSRRRGRKGATSDQFRDNGRVSMEWKDGRALGGAMHFQWRGGAGAMGRDYTRDSIPTRPASARPRASAVRGGSGWQVGSRRPRTWMDALTPGNTWNRARLACPPTRFPLVAWRWWGPRHSQLESTRRHGPLNWTRPTPSHSLSWPSWPSITTSIPGSRPLHPPSPPWGRDKQGQTQTATPLKSACELAMARWAR
jgi:hypothetical protein